MHLLAVCVSSLEKCLFKPSTPVSLSGDPGWTIGWCLLAGLLLQSYSRLDWFLHQQMGKLGAWGHKDQHRAWVRWGQTDAKDHWDMPSIWVHKSLSRAVTGWKPGFAGDSLETCAVEAHLV